MASLMDIGLLQFFSNLFLFLFIFAGTYALLVKSKLFGESKNLVSIIAIAVAIIVIVTDPVAEFLLYILPWFFVLSLVILMFIFAGKLFGVSDSSISNSFHWKKTPIVTWVIIFVVLIIVFGFSNLYGQQLLENNPDINATSENGDGVSIVGDAQIPVNSNQYGSNVLATLTHPKVIGMVVILIVGMLAILLITQSGFPKFS